MSTLSIRLPDSLHDGVRAAAERDGISINQFIASAVGEKLAALETERLLEERARRGSRDKFERVLEKIRSVGNPPLPGDEAG